MPNGIKKSSTRGYSGPAARASTEGTPRDGYMTSAMRSKLNGIESNATADMTPQEIAGSLYILNELSPASFPSSFPNGVTIGLASSFSGWPMEFPGLVTTKKMGMQGARQTFEHLYDLQTFVRYDEGTDDWSVWYEQNKLPSGGSPNSILVGGGGFRAEWEPRNSPIYYSIRRGRTTNLSVANSTWTTVPFTSSEMGGASRWVTATTNYTVDEDGIYALSHDYQYAANNTGSRFARWLIDGSTIYAASGITGAQAQGVNSLTLYLNAGQVIQAQTFQNSGGALNYVFSGCHLFISKVG